MCPCPRATPHSFHRPPRCPKGSALWKAGQPYPANARSQERGAEMFPTTGESSWQFHLTERLLRQFSLCYPRENDTLSILTELFLVHLHQHILPFLGQPSPNWQKCSYSWCSQQGGKQKECSDSPWITALLKKKKKSLCFQTVLIY